MHSKEFTKSLSAVIDLLRNSKKIILACHANPDGDAIGAMLAFGLGLKKIKKNVVMLCPDKIPERYITLPGAKRIKHEYKDVADLAIAIDCGSITQLARLEKAFSRSTRIVEIDHHFYRTRFGDIQLVEKTLDSAAEIVFTVLKKMRIEMDKRIGECLLISTLTETATFSRESLGKETFEFCSMLMNYGVDYHAVSEKYFLRRRLSTFKLTGRCYDRIKLVSKNRLAWSIIYQSDYKEFHGTKEDIDMVPDDMMMINDIQIVLLFREIENNMLRVSLRSTDKINIGSLATVYGGGGHKNVAGCRIHNNERTIQRFIRQASKLLK